MSTFSQLRTETMHTLDEYRTSATHALDKRWSKAKRALDAHRTRARRAFDRRVGGLVGDTTPHRSESTQKTQDDANDDSQDANGDTKNNWGDDDSDSNSTDGSRDSSIEDGSDTESEWSEADLPTEKALNDVVTTQNGPFAVGTNGNVLARTDGEWKTVIDAGPGANRNALTAADTTTDGKRVWFAGSSGALGYYDLETGRKHDYSAPKQKTSTWEAIAVTGEAGSETLRVANGSGEVLPITTGEDGCPEWGEVIKPAGGSTMAALDYGDGTCYAVDTSGNALVEAEDGWTDIGVENAQVNFFDLAATKKTVLIAGGDGLVYRYDRACKNWTPVRAGTGALHAIDHVGGETLAVGASGGIYERTPKTGWTQCPSPVEDDLAAVALGDPAVAVGSEGTAIERVGKGGSQR